MTQSFEFNSSEKQLPYTNEIFAYATLNRVGFDELWKVVPYGGS